MSRDIALVEKSRRRLQNVTAPVQSVAEWPLTCFAAIWDRAGLVRIGGLAVTTVVDQILADTDETSDPPSMSLEAARDLAAALAPHLAAMRAVAAGTIGDIGVEVASESAGDGAQPLVSPTTMIFIAGMLERLSA